MFSSWEKELNLTDVIGYSKFKYFKSDVTSNPDSLQRLWSQAVYPAVVFNNLSSLRQFPIIGSGTIRDHLFQGDVYRDDVFTIVPFPN